MIYESTRSGLWAPLQATRNSRGAQSTARASGVPRSGVYLVDRKRVITDWNRAAELIAGFHREKAVGERCTTLLKHTLRGEKNALCGTICPLNASIVTENLGKNDVEAHFQNGDKQEVWVRTYPLWRYGEPVGGIHVFGLGDGDDPVERQETVGSYEESDLKNLATELTDHSSWSHLEDSVLSLTETGARHVVRISCTPKVVKHPDVSGEVLVPLYFYRKESPTGHKVTIRDRQGDCVPTLSEKEAGKVAARALAQAIGDDKGHSPLTVAQWSHLESLTRHDATARERAMMLLDELRPLTKATEDLIGLLSRNHLRFALIPAEKAQASQVLSCEAEVPYERHQGSSSRRRGRR